MSLSTEKAIGTGPLLCRAFVCDASDAGLSETATAPSGSVFAVTIKDVAGLVSVVTAKKFAATQLRQSHFETAGHFGRNTKKVSIVVDGQKGKNPVGALLKSRFLHLNNPAEVKVLDATLRSAAFLPLLKAEYQKALADDSGPDLLCGLLEKR